MAAFNPWDVIAPFCVVVMVLVDPRRRNGSL
jgi:hypothetical protein